jgi:hypothetical protein
VDKEHELAINNELLSIVLNNKAGYLAGIPGIFHKILWTWRGHRHLPLGGAACRRIRTRDFFSAMDKMVGAKLKMVIYYIYYHPKSPYNSLPHTNRAGDRSLWAVTAYLYPNCAQYASL